MCTNVCVIQRLPDQIKERNEKMKEEMIGTSCYFFTSTSFQKIVSVSNFCYHIFQPVMAKFQSSHKLKSQIFFAK